MKLVTLDFAKCFCILDTNVMRGCMLVSAVVLGKSSCRCHMPFFKEWRYSD